MSRYSKGETSAAKLQEKHAITRSLLTKILLIRKAVEEHQKIPSLDALKSKRGVSFKAALAWTDVDLGVVSCSYNTSQKPYNIEHSNHLSAAIESYNKISDSANKPTSQIRITQRSQSEEISALKHQIDYLTNTLAEIYRAYMQLSARVDEQTRQDLRYQQVLKSHTRALDNAHLTLVKP